MGAFDNRQRHMINFWATHKMTGSQHDGRVINITDVGVRTFLLEPSPQVAGN
jgi:hypothetical protein